MPEIQPFTFPDTGAPVRVVEIDGEPWFVATDVCAVLAIANARQAVSYLDDDEVRQEPVTTNDGSGRTLPTNVVSESGLYSLILRSRKPEAHAFKRWITHDVLPVIRRTGGYGQVAAPATYAEALRALADQHEATEAAQQRAAELAPAAHAWDVLADATGDYSLREAAQLLDRDPVINTGQNRLSRTLRDIGWTDASGQPYQRHVDTGRLVRRTLTYPHPRTGVDQVTTQPRITAKGLRELYELLRGGGQLQLIEGGAS